MVEDKPKIFGWASVSVVNNSFFQFDSNVTWFVSDLVDFDDSYDSEDSFDSIVKMDPENDILIYTRLIRKSLTLKPM